MEASFSSAPARSARRPLAGLGKLAVGMLAATAALIGYAQMLFGGFDPMMSGIAVLFLVVAGVVLAGWRWAPLAGTLVFGLLLALLAMLGGEIAFTLAHPGQAMFSFFVVAIAVVATGFVASIGAAAQNYRGAERPTPRWLPGALLLIGGLVAGAAAVGAIPQSGDVAGADSATLAQLPAITLDKFEGGEIRVRAGDTAAFRIENPDPVAHTFTVDELGVDAFMPAGKNSLALFNPAQPGTYTFYCRPHYDKASGEGMHGTLIVE